MAHIDTPETQKANRRFIQQAMKKPLLEADHEVELARAWRENGDQKALHQLTIAYMRLVISVAGKFRNYGLPMADLVQEGNVGLMQAAARFDPETGCAVFNLRHLVDPVLHSRLCVAELVNCPYGDDGFAKITLFQTAPPAGHAG